MNLVYQGKVCLTLGFGNCPVYKKEAFEPLPKEYRGSLPSRQKPKYFLSLLILLLVIVAGLTLSGLLGIIKIPGLNFPFQSTQATATFTKPTSFVLVPPPSPTVPITETVIPTASLSTLEVTPFSPHKIETPFGENPTLVIHQVRAGEGFILLAEQYGTSVEAIKAINYQLPEYLWVNNILVIPVNTRSVVGLPKFIVREISTEGMTIEDYAQRMQLNADLLKRYNALPDGYMLEMGELIIIPN